MVRGVAARLLLSVGTEGRLDRAQSPSQKHKCTTLDLHYVPLRYALAQCMLSATLSEEHSFHWDNHPLVLPNNGQRHAVDLTRTYQSVYPPT